MKPYEDHETAKARDWDEDTVIGELDSDHRQDMEPILHATPQRSSQGINGSRNPFALSNSSPNVTGSRGYPATPPSHGRSYQDGQYNRGNRGSVRGRGRGGARGGGHGGQVSGRSSSTDNEAFTPRSGPVAFCRGSSGQVPSTGRARSSQGQRGGLRYLHSRHSSESPVKNSKFAESMRLVTTKQANENDEKAAKAAKIALVLGPPKDSINYPTEGFYMWPSKESGPSELLGLRLEKLNPVRLQNWVHIVEMTGAPWLRICPLVDNIQPELNIQQAMLGIRAALKDVIFKDEASKSIYIVTPPSVGAMRKIVRPSRVELILPGSVESLAKKKSWKVFGPKFAGDNLSQQEQLAWKNLGRKALADSNLSRFEDHLTRNLTALANDKTKMRMRLHFGRAVLNRSLPAFKDERMDFQGFVAMMQQKGMSTDFEKKNVDPRVALKLSQLLMQSPDQFRPSDATIISLEDAGFLETAIIVVRKSDDEELRIEVALDKNSEDADGRLQYQAGTITHFRHNREYLRMQIETLNIEREQDYVLSVISDDGVCGINNILLKVTDHLVDKETKVYRDELGLLYPNITPQGVPNLETVSITVCSTIRYLFKESSYIVEIAIDRQWPIGTIGPEMKLVASVSIQHQDWDWHMRSIKDTPEERGWSPDLSEFFDSSSDENSSPLAGFLAKVEIIQSYLHVASNPEAHAEVSLNSQETSIQVESEQQEDFQLLEDAYDPLQDLDVPDLYSADD